MKKFFTLATAFGLAASAFAAPVDLSGVKAELTPAAQQRMNKNVAALMQNNLTDIDGQVISKRSFIQGNVEWDCYAIVTGNVCDNITLSSGKKLTFDELPQYAVEYAVMGYNRTTGENTSVLALMLMWPTKYYDQLMTWTGPWDHTVETGSDGQQHDVYDIPLADRNYDIVPVEDLLPGKPLAAPFKLTGYIGPFDREGETELPEQWAGPWAWAALGYGGLTYNGRDVQFNADGFTLQNPNGACPTVIWNDYSVEENGTGFDENFNVSNSFPLYTGTVNASGQFVQSGTANLNLEYDGTGFTNGFVAHNYNFTMSDFHIFNAGTLNEDDNRFYVMPEDDSVLQQYYVMGCDDNMVISWTQKDDAAVQKDPSFTNCIDNNRYVKFFLSSEEADANNAYYYYGYLFSAPNDGVAPADQQWNLKLAEDHEETIFGQTVVYNDWLVPQAQMFVPYGLYSSIENREKSAWSNAYGTAAVYKGFSAYPSTENSYMAINTPDGFVLNYGDEFGNKYNVTFTGECIYHPDFDNILDMAKLDVTGTFNPEGSAVKNIFGDFSGVKVSARNGMININAVDAADVQIFSLNGQLVNATKVNGNNAISVPVAKGAYIVKVGNVARKVVL